MKKLIRKTGIGITLALAVAMCTATTAFATTSVYVDPSDHKMRVVAEDGVNNHIQIYPYFMTNSFQIDDYDYISTGTGCEPLDDDSAFCTGVTNFITVWAGDGDDWVDAYFATQPLWVDGEEGDDSITGVRSWTGGSPYNILRGGSGNDNLSGSVRNDQIIGHSGNDVINGRDGEDTIWGESGNDTITGYHGNDSLYGGSGTDSIDAGNGADSIFLRDGENDSADCGGDSDGVSADLLPNDSSLSNCETVGRS